MSGGSNYTDNNADSSSSPISVFSNSFEHVGEGSTDYKPKKYDFEQDHNVVTDTLVGLTTLEELLHVPNIAADQDLPREIMRIVNAHGCSAGKSTFGRTIVEPGRIGLINNNGKVEVVGQGRWAIPSPRSRWVGVRSLTENPIQYESLTILRVNKGEYGLALENGKPILLAEGLHVRNTRMFQHVNLARANQKHLVHQTINILIVPSTEYALVIENNIPKVLKPGMYVIDSIFFEVVGFEKIDQEHIQHQTIHIIRVPKGKVALVNVNNKFALLPEGNYVFNTQVFVFSKIVPINENAIVHGTINRFRVRNGEIGLAWNHNKPVFIEKPDFYEIDSPAFTFVKCVSASEKNIVLGSHKRIIVYQGEVGISYLNGALDILPPKTHYFDSTERIFQGFMSTKQQSLQLIEDGSKDKFLSCDTKDFVEVGLKAVVFYRISNAEKALLSVGEEKAIEKLIKETSIATLQTIMRSTALNEVAQTKSVVHDESRIQESKSTGVPLPSAPPFFDKLHDEFISHLASSFNTLYGIQISNVRIESFKIMNQQLSDNISQQAIITAQTETKLANLEGQREIATAEMERESAVVRIKTQAAAFQMGTEAEAKNNTVVTEARAKAEASKIVAQGEAEAMLIKANAEAKSIEMKAAAERKRAEELSANPLGAQLALLAIQSQTITSSMQGVQKVIYLPTGANLSSTPMQLFGLPQMNVPSLEDANFNSVSTAETTTKEFSSTTARIANKQKVIQ